jgi:hypothetical protein
MKGWEYKQGRMYHEIRIRLLAMYWANGEKKQMVAEFKQS